MSSLIFNSSRGPVTIDTTGLTDNEIPNAIRLIEVMNDYNDYFPVMNAHDETLRDVSFQGIEPIWSYVDSIENAVNLANERYFLETYGKLEVVKNNQIIFPLNDDLIIFDLECTLESLRDYPVISDDILTDIEECFFNEFLEQNDYEDAYITVMRESFIDIEFPLNYMVTGEELPDYCDEKLLDAVKGEYGDNDVNEMREVLQSIAKMAIAVDNGAYRDRLKSGRISLSHVYSLMKENGVHA